MTATTTQLVLYNKALRHLGERKLASLSENREPRRYLDDEYNDTVLLCLRSGMWNFATATVQPSAAGASIGYSRAFTKPADWIRTVVVSQSSTFDYPLRDHRDEGGKWHTNVTPIYVKYISSTLGLTLTSWPADFVEYVGVALARAIASRITQDEELVQLLEKRENEYRERALILDAKDQPRVPWPAIYSRALSFLGERELMTPEKSTEVRYFLDDVYDNVVQLCLRSGLWNFAMRAIKIDGCGSSGGQPSFGYQSMFPKPDDWIRTSLISTSETFDPPCRDYQDQDGVWLANTGTLYARYVSRTLGETEDRWPIDFAEYVAVALANRIAGRITQDVNMLAALEKREKLFWKRALCNDAMDQPPSPWPLGTWTTNRIRRGVLPPYSNSIRNY